MGLAGGTGRVDGDGRALPMWVAGHEFARTRLTELLDGASQELPLRARNVDGSLG
jgi:hypothetical protein